jgi:hypothetical protein
MYQNKGVHNTTLIYKSTLIKVKSSSSEEPDGPGQCARRAIAKAKQLSHWSVIGWVTKIYYLELFRALKAR